MKAKIYTKTGDRGTTGLVGGARVSKSHVRLEAYGTLDELNSVLGLVRSSLVARPSDARGLDPRVRRIQHALFDIGSHLACELDDVRPKLPNVDASDVAALEADMDAWENELSPLRNFILPGGTESASRTHLARTVCRRAERDVQRMIEEGIAVESTQAIFLNRLSDWLFLLARVLNADAGVPDVPWEKA